MATSKRQHTTASWMPYHKPYVIRSFPLCRVKVHHPAQTIQRVIPRKPKRKRCPGCLAHAMISVLGESFGYPTPTQPIYKHDPTLKTKMRYPGCLAQAVNTVVCFKASLVTDDNPIYIHSYVLQCVYIPIEGWICTPISPSTPCCPNLALNIPVLGRNLQVVLYPTPPTPPCRGA